MSLKHRQLLLITFLFLIGIGGGYELYPHMHPASQFTEVRANDPTLHFTNPLLFYKSQPDSRYDSLKSDLSSYIATAKSKGDVTDVSVYYRDMNTGEWTGIDENTPYEPASMLKVTMMIAYLKGSVDHPDVLTKQLYYKPLAEGEYYESQDVVPEGYYSANKLIDLMITYSDNDALVALEAGDQNRTADVFKAFELPLPTATTTDFMSARNYSRVFRVLYDSTYLPWDVSEEALALLSQTKFTQGIVSGVPEGTVVSHKFGERTLLDSAGAIKHRELHDCGIVYKPGKPYFICVMTKGSDFPKLLKVISDISTLTYKEN